jgi:hypothetical protein
MSGPGFSRLSGRRAAAVVLAVVLLLAGARFPWESWAQTSPGHDLSWHVLSGGGQDSATVAHAVRGSLGQFAIGPAAAAAGHSLGSGYWYGVQRALQPSRYRVYLPLVVRNH